MSGTMSKSDKILFLPKTAFKSAVCSANYCAHTLGIAKPRQKVFAIGFNKTGTSSLHELFVAMKYHSFHGEYWRKTSSTKFHILYDAFCDGIPEDFRELDRAFPNSKFILQVRDLDSWLSSRIEHINRRSSNRKNKISDDWTVENESIMEWIIQRNKHHLDVMSYFENRPDDLLIINYIRDPGSVQKISSFLNSDIQIAKPHANKAKARNVKLKNSDLIENCFELLNLPKEEWKSDLVCKSLIAESPAEFHGAYDTDELQVESIK